MTETKEKQEVNGSVWLWTVIGVIAGYFTGGFSLGVVEVLLGVNFSDGIQYLSVIVGAGIVGFLAYRSSSKNGGNAPTWLWKSKKK